jgi:uncharacterized protein YbjT (DUF2867 family)
MRHDAHPEGAAEFAAAARKAGVEHVVLLSSSTVLYPDAAASPIALRHLAAERALDEAGLDRTFVRPGLLRHERAALVAVDPHRARPAHRVPRSGFSSWAAAYKMAAAATCPSAPVLVTFDPKTFLAADLALN